MAEILEGATRKNPTTGVEEFYNPEGVWTQVTNTEQVKPTGSIDAGSLQDNIDVNVGNLPKAVTTTLDSMVSSTAGLPAFYQTQYDEAVKKEADLKAKQTTLGEKPIVDVAGARTSAQEEYQVPEWLKQTQAQSVKVAALQGEIDKINVLEQQEIDNARTQLANIPTYIVDRQVNDISRKYASQKAYKAAELSGEAALLQAYAGNLGEARNLANDAVEAYVYDITQERADFDNLFNLYGDWIDSLDKEQKDILTTARAEIINKEETTKEEQTQVMQWSIDSNGKAGIKIGDSLADAYTKYTNWLASQPSTTGVTPTTGFNNAEVESSFREDGASLNLQVRAGAITVEEAYTQLRDLYSPSEVSDQAIKDYLGITPATATPETPQTISEQKKQTALNKVENVITLYKNQGLDNKTIKKYLKGRFPTDVIDASSVGSSLSQTGNAIYNWLFQSKPSWER